MSSTATTTLSAAPQDGQSVSLKATGTGTTSSGKLLNYGADGKPTYQVPTFSNKVAERKWAKEQVAGAFRVFGKFGYVDGGAGHISLRGSWNC